MPIRRTTEQRRAKLQNNHVVYTGGMLSRANCTDRLAVPPIGRACPGNERSRHGPYFISTGFDRWRGPPRRRW